MASQDSWHPFVYAAAAAAAMRIFFSSSSKYDVKKKKKKSPVDFQTVGVESQTKRSNE